VFLRQLAGFAEKWPSNGPFKKGIKLMSKRILVVDDSSMMRKMITNILNPPGHIVIGQAKSGEEAVAMYRELKPDLVTMDITMRGMDGLTAAKEIFSFDANAQIIFLSNLNEEKYKDEVREMGAVGFVNKYKAAEILDLIDGI
jgi:two-component system chemotaxis response regulator CheY